MASPHVAGAIALYLQTNTGASPATVTQALVAASTPNKVTNPGTGSPNRLLYSLFGHTAATTAASAATSSAAASASAAARR